MANTVNLSEVLKVVADQEDLTAEVYVRIHNSDPILVTDLRQEEVDGKAVIIFEVN